MIRSRLAVLAAAAMVVSLAGPADASTVKITDPVNKGQKQGDIVKVVVSMNRKSLEVDTTFRNGYVFSFNAVREFLDVRGNSRPDYMAATDDLGNIVLSKIHNWKGRPSKYTPCDIAHGGGRNHLNVTIPLTCLKNGAGKKPRHGRVNIYSPNEAYSKWDFAPAKDKWTPWAKVGK
jgi:hypothetical protein